MATLATRVRIKRLARWSAGNDVFRSVCHALCSLSVTNAVGEASVASPAAAATAAGRRKSGNEATPVSKSAVRAAARKGRDTSSIGKASKFTRLPMSLAEALEEEVSAEAHESSAVLVLVVTHCTAIHIGGCSFRPSADSS